MLVLLYYVNTDQFCISEEFEIYFFSTEDVRFFFVRKIV